MKTKPQQLSHKTLKITIWYGYILYAVFVLTQAIFVSNTLPRTLGSPAGSDRIIALYVGLVGALLLPPLIAYLVGYFTVSKTKISYLRQFNGVIAGIGALWLSFALSHLIYRFAIPHPDYIPLQVYQFGYAIIATIAILAVLVSYVLTKSKQNFVFYKPLSFVLMGSIFTWFIFQATGGPGGISSLVATASSSTQHLILTILSIASTPIVFGLSYYFSPIKITGLFNKIALTSILTALFMSLVIAIRALLTSTDILGSLEHIILLEIISYPAALIIWSGYMRIIKQPVTNK